MSKSTLVEMIQHRFASAKEADEAVDSVIAGIKQMMAEDKQLVIPRFGTFLRRRSAERTGRNMHTGEPIKIAAKDTVKFRSHMTL